MTDVAKLYPVGYNLSFESLYLHFLINSTPAISVLETLISSKTRVKLLMRLFLNPDSRAYLRGLAEEFNESTNSVRLELNRFEEAGMLHAVRDGKKKVFKANTKYPLYNDIRNILLKYTGLQEVIERVIERVGDIREVHLIGDLAYGKASEDITLVIIGTPDYEYVDVLIEKAKQITSKHIEYTIYQTSDYPALLKEAKYSLLLWHEAGL